MTISQQKPAAIFLMGATATGKTDLAIALSHHLPVEIINVDSTLVYRGMDIGTAKPDADTLIRAPHHLVNIRDPSESYSAAHFAKDAIPLMAAISAKGKIPLLVGGTMLYFRVLLEGLADLPPSNKSVRDAIVKEGESLGWPEMHRQLDIVDPESAAKIHPNHSQRIQRALEIYRLSGQTASALKNSTPNNKTIAAISDDYRIAQLALLPQSREFLHQRIAQRFHQMLEQGLIAEVEALKQRADLDQSLPAIRAVGYRQVWDYLEGIITEDEMIFKAIVASRQLAKRQLTWLRGWPNLHSQYIDDGQQQLISKDHLLTTSLQILKKLI